MSDINKYRRLYHIFITQLAFILFWYVICEVEVQLVTVAYTKFHIIAGSSILLLSLILKRFKNIITVSLIAFIGISLLILIFEDNIVFGFAFYSLAFSILSVDAVYSQSALRKKLFIFLITFLAFSSLLTIADVISLSGVSNGLNILKPKVKTIEEKVAKQDPPAPQKDSSVSLREEPVKTNSESIKETLKLIEKENIKKEVNSFIGEWRAAWQLRNIKKYKSFYSDDLISSDKDGKEYSYSEKMKTAEKNFKRYGYIKVYFEDISFEFDDDYPNEVTVKMKQTYNSDKYSDFGIKTLMIFKGKSTNYKWKIYREKFEIIKNVQQQRTPVVTNKKDGDSVLVKICYGSSILIIIIMLIVFVKKVLK